MFQTYESAKYPIFWKDVDESVYSYAELMVNSSWFYADCKLTDGVDAVTSTYLSFLNCDDWCMNEFQVTNQISIEGKRKNRYDVTILINGLPLVQIELKRRGAELKVAFNQINRYQHESYDAGHGLFQYVQMFIISNGVNTKYFSNNKEQAFQQTFFWTDKDNNRLSDLKDFAAEFLKQCHLPR